MKFNLGDKVRVRSNGVIGIIISRGYNEYLNENDKQQSFEEYQIEADKYYQCNEDEIELCNPILEVTKDTMNKIYDGILNIKPISDNRVKYEIDNNGNMFKLGDTIKEMKCGNCCKFDKTTGICEYNNIAVCRDSGGICEGYYPSVQEIEVEGNENNNDPVNPSYYTDTKIEVMDYIEDKGFNFALGNAVKYISRAGKKDADKTIQDLEKANWYLNREIERLKNLQGDK